MSETEGFVGPVHEWKSRHLVMANRQATSKAHRRNTVPSPSFTLVRHLARPQNDQQKYEKFEES